MAKKIKKIVKVPKLPKQPIIQHKFGSTFVPKPPFHRDYRIVLNDVWMTAIQKDKRQGGIPVEQRDIFEHLGSNNMPENPVAQMIRALGAYETAFYEKYGAPIALDGLESKHWMMMWEGLRVLLSCSLRDPLDGGTLYSCLVCLALNAGFKREDFE